MLDQTATFSGTVAGFGAQNHIDLPSIAFGAPTTLGYTENSTNTGGTLTISDGSHAASIALLGNYIAASFVTAVEKKPQGRLLGAESICLSAVRLNCINLMR